MGLIYTNNSSGAIRKLKKQKPKKSYLNALKDHIKYLRSLGLNVDRQGKVIIAERQQGNILLNENRPKSIVQTTPQKVPVMGNGGKKDERWKLEISKNYSVMPAYNKGPYMVVAKEDIKTAGKKI